METSRIFIKGLPPNITESEFRKHFSTKDRQVTDIKLIPKRHIGYVGYKTAAEASTAIKFFNRSYIRMSKIAVEAARPISDSAPAVRRGDFGPVHTLPAHDDTNTRPIEESGSRKRKREDIDGSNPRLREFLQVMKPGREGINAEGLDLDSPSAHVLKSDAQLAEGDSDDEYEQLPSRDRKVSKNDIPERQQTETLNSTQEERPSSIKTMPETKVTHVSEDSNKLDTNGSTAADGTDGDWLRSRTNRVLDLVDPVDLAPGAISHSDTDQNATEMKEHAILEHVGKPQHQNLSSDLQEPKADGDGADPTLDAIRRTSRLFVRNLPFDATEEDVRITFEQYGHVEEVHLPSTSAGSGKGFALVLFGDASGALSAFQALDRSTFQGRILHILPANAKKQTGLDEFEISKLPLKKQNLVRKRAEAASNTFNWNALYMSQDAVNTSVAQRLGISKTELLDPTSADAAVKQAIAETSVIQETKSYFAANGVDLDAFKSHKRGDVAILVKNFPYGTTIDELRTLFEESGPVLRVLMPPSGTIAIVEFAQPNHAKTAFGKLAYRRLKDSVLFLEKAPNDLFKQPAESKTAPVKDRPPSHETLRVNDLLSHGDRAADENVDTTSLFVRNLNFATTTSKLAETFGSLDGFFSARVKTKLDAKKPGQTLSMGFGFVEFRSKEQAQAALKVMDGYLLDGHTLAVKASHKGLDAAEERRREDKARKAAGQRTKIVIRNLPFQATKKDVRALFGTYGQLRSIRVPKKQDYTSRGFAFADFVTPREAENALNALRDTHLLGRKLVLDFAEAEAIDAEEEIEKMQRKVGGQVNKVALQKLTGGGRTKVNIGADEEEDTKG